MALGTFVTNRDQAERIAVLYGIRHHLAPHGNIGFLSYRLLCTKKLHMSHAKFERHTAALIAMGELCRVSARGRGRGRGRTLYWLPGGKRPVRKRTVMQLLKQEGMPMAAYLEAERFFFSRENAPHGGRQEALRDTSGLKKKKDARATRANGPPDRAGPPRQEQIPTNKPSSTPPSLGRLVKHGLASDRLRAEQLESALERIRGAIRRRNAF